MRRVLGLPGRFENKLVINYLYNNITSSEELLSLLNKKYQRYITRDALTIRELIFPSNIKVPKRFPIERIGKYVVLKDVAPLLNNNADLLSDIIRNRKLFLTTIDALIKTPILLNTMNEHIIGILKDLRYITTIRWRSWEYIILTLGRVPKSDTIRELKSYLWGGKNIHSMNIDSLALVASTPRILPLYLTIPVGKTPRIEIVHYVSDIYSFLKPEHKDWNPLRLQKEIAYHLASKYNYEIKTTESGKYHLLINKDLIPQGILIQVISRYTSIPHYMIIPEIKRRYGLRSLGRLLIFQNPLYRSIRGWHVIYWDVRKGWKIRYVNDESKIPYKS